MLKEQIAASLEQAFSELGFAEPSVAQLKTACGVSYAPCTSITHLRKT